MPDPSPFGRNVVRLRTARAWSQSELARRSGVSQTFISSLEGGRRAKATTDTAQALARALGVTVDELLRPAPTEPTVLDALAVTALERGDAEAAKEAKRAADQARAARRTKPPIVP